MMRNIAALLALAGSLALSATSSAQSVIACRDAWGSSSSCGGCTGLVWSSPDGADKVKTPASDFWQRLDSLKSTDLVSIATGKTEGQAAKCSEVTGTATVASLLGQPTTPPPTEPPTTPCAGSMTVSWTAPTSNPDGSPAHVIGYRIDYTGPQAGSVNVGLVLTKTIDNLNCGDYTIRVVAIDATADPFSVPSNPVLKTVTSAPPTPTEPPPNPTPPTVTAVEVLGTWQAKKGATNVANGGGHATYAACFDFVKTLATPTPVKYSCVPVGGSITVSKP